MELAAFSAVVLKSPGRHSRFNGFSGGSHVEFVLKSLSSGNAPMMTVASHGFPCILHGFPISPMQYWRVM